MKHIFIVNPAAGAGRGEKEVLPLIHAEMRESGLDYEIHRTLNKPEIGEYIRKNASSGEPVRFYACGGDGTANDVLSGVVDFPNAEIAVIPCGTGNDFAKNFTQPSLLKSVRALVDAKAQPCDVIKYSGGYCLNMLNIGVDCDVVVAGMDYKERFKGFSYVIGAVKVLSKGNTYTMKYEIDGEEKEEELMLCAIANGQFCGGGFRSCPKASITDGLMDIGLVRPVKGLKLPLLLAQYHGGKHLESKAAEGLVSYIQCRKFRLTPSCDVNVSVDGEVSKFTGSEFEVIPGGVRVAVPDGCELI